MNIVLDDLKYSNNVILNTLEIIPDLLDRKQVLKMMEMKNTNEQSYHLWSLFDIGIFLNKFNFSGA